MKPKEKLQLAINHFFNSVDNMTTTLKLFKCSKKAFYKYLKTIPNYKRLKFIAVSNIIHSNKYDYSLVHNIKENSEKVTIICLKHGEFKKSIYSHWRGFGCPKCGYEKISLSRSYSFLDFVKKSNEIHNFKYDYSKAVYINAKTKLIVICPYHGEFEQTSGMHLRGAGCPKCKYKKTSERLLDTTENFIKKSKLKYGDKYDYSNTVYGKNAHEKVIITCKKHGDFKIAPANHLSKTDGGGCQKCSFPKQERWTKRAWKEICEGKIAKLYIIKCWNENEEFYKIGITAKKEIKGRFSGKDMPYKYEVLKLIESKDCIYIWNLEKELHRKNKEFKYKPLIKFGGWTECFSKIY